MQADMLDRIVKALRIPKDHRELCPRLQQSIIDAIAQDRFDVAKTLAGIDTGTISEDGKTYVGRNQNNVRITAKLISLGDSSKE